MALIALYLGGGGRGLLLMDSVLYNAYKDPQASI